MSIHPTKITVFGDISADEAEQALRRTETLSDAITHNASDPFDWDEAEAQSESETEPTGCYRALAWIRKSMGAAA